MEQYRYDLLPPSGSLLADRYKDQKGVETAVNSVVGGDGEEMELLGQRLE